ncbi:unnamed protein product [Withania somnifera]
MDNNDWDIGTVVRNCDISRPSNMVAPNLGSESMNFENDDWDFLNRPSNMVAPNLGSESMNFENDDWDFLKRLLDVDITGFDCLDDIIFPMDFSVAHQGKPYNQSSETINPTTPVPIITDQFKVMDQNDNQQIFLPPPPPAEPAPSGAITSLQLNDDLQQQLMMCANIHPTFTRSPLVQISERKNQPIRIVYELMEEELTDDTWTWRKYGRKRIKGSPFSRNYYKCSTSDQCQAKKQIEKSPKDDKIFLVGYSGIHNHDPPLSRSSLPGWNGSSKEKLLRSISIEPKALSLNASSSSSKRAKRSRAALETDSTSPKKKKMVAVDKVDGEEEDNKNEDILMSIEELNGVTAST